MFVAVIIYIIYKNKKLKQKTSDEQRIIKEYYVRRKEERVNYDYLHDYLVWKDEEARLINYYSKKDYEEHLMDEAEDDEDWEAAEEHVRCFRVPLETAAEEADRPVTVFVPHSQVTGQMEC